MQLPVAAPRQRFVVGDEYQRGALRAVEFQHQFDDLAAGGGVEVAGRLICKQYLRLDDKSAGDRHALLLAAGEVLGQVIHALRQSHAPQGYLSLLGG
jgi:hypothetical protein